MKKIISLIVLAAVAAACGVFIPRLAHTCDDCGNFFVGTGYRPNVIADILTDTEQIICKGCAEEQHALSILVGKSLDEFKRGLFD